MNLKSAKRAIPAYKKFLLGGGGLFTVAECAFIMFFLPYMSFMSIPMGAIIPILIVAIALPCFVMPFVYAIINGSTVISTGRYHLPLVICALLACLFNILLFSLHYITSWFAGVMLFLLLFGLSLTMQIYFYVYCSICTRMDSSGKTDNFRLMFSCVGAIVAGALGFVFFDGTAYSISQISCVISTIMLASLLLVYMSSFTAMPFFIRIEPASNYSLRQNYTRYLQPLKQLESRLTLIALLLISVGVILALECYGLFAVAFGAEIKNVGFGFLVALVTIVVFTPIFKRIFKNNYNTRVFGASVVAAIIACLVTLMIVLTVVFKLYGDFKSVVLYFSASMVGVVSSIFLAAQKPLHTHIKSNSEASYGNAFSLMRLVIVLGLALASGVSVAVWLASSRITRLGVAIFLACLISAIIISAAVVLRFSLIKKREKQDA